VKNGIKNINKSHPIKHRFYSHFLFISFNAYAAKK